MRTSLSNEMSGVHKSTDNETVVTNLTLANTEHTANATPMPTTMNQECQSVESMVTMNNVICAHNQELHLSTMNSNTTSADSNSWSQWQTRQITHWLVSDGSGPVSFSFCFTYLVFLLF